MVRTSKEKYKISKTVVAWKREGYIDNGTYTKNLKFVEDLKLRDRQTDRHKISRRTSTFPNMVGDGKYTKQTQVDRRTQTQTRTRIQAKGKRRKVFHSLAN